ncbi:hypothetical protein ACTXT7_011384 [Hymenolepis weldensis]
MHKNQSHIVCCSQSQVFPASTVKPCGVHKANKVDRITCARTGWKVRYVTGRAEDKRGVCVEASSASQQSRSRSLVWFCI